MTTPASTIRDEVWELIQSQIETFRQPMPLTPSELTECHYRAERIKQLGQQLDQMSSTAILEKRFAKVA